MTPEDRHLEPAGEGGDPACWAHLFEDGQADEGDEVRPETEVAPEP